MLIPRKVLAEKLRRVSRLVVGQGVARARQGHDDLVVPNVDVKSSRGIVHRFLSFSPRGSLSQRKGRREDGPAAASWLPQAPFWLLRPLPRDAAHHLEHSRLFCLELIDRHDKLADYAFELEDERRNRLGQEADVDEALNTNAVPWTK